MARVLWFHPRQLLPPRGGGDLRTSGLLRGVLAAGHQVLFVQPANDLPPGPALPGAEFVTVEQWHGPALAGAKILSRSALRSPRPAPSAVSRTKTRIARFRPQVAIVSEVMARPLADALLPDGVPWIYDAHNLEGELFAAHLQAATRPAERLTLSIDQARVAASERRLARAADAVLAVSDHDAAGLQEMAPGVEVVVAPSSMEAPASPDRPGQAPPTALFVGTLDFTPNVQALDWLFDEILPALRTRVPESRLLVVGRRPLERHRRLLDSTPGVEFWEDAPDIAAAYATARCVLMPFQTASGTKLKAYEALAHGVPLVTTPQGIHGVDVRPETDALVADDADGLVLAATRLLTDPGLAADYGAAARRAFEARLSWEGATWPQVNELIGRLTA